ncbi:ARM repeat-containing protein [Patellaria atrata CBS 101060]|uniref:ARM repeat-containing protein n=1 Tax=Patellaria atrata CBS 101060 TaxID=1346257 RepID=A0A9P4VQV2_9PEZI|nr:ARM repeat-containing protein [Patellaria atrata CBS 101060]
MTDNSFSVHQDRDHASPTGVKRQSQSFAQNDQSVPLTTSKLANQHFKKPKVENSNVKNIHSISPMDQLLARLSEQQVKLQRQKETLATADSSPNTASSGDSGKYMTTPDTQRGDIQNAAELLQLRKELEAAKETIARMDQELHVSRITKHTLHSIETPSEADMDDDIRASVSNVEKAIWSSNVDPYPSFPNNGWNEVPRNNQYNIPTFQQPRTTPVQHFRGDSFRNGLQYLSQPTHFNTDQSFRGFHPPTRPGSAIDPRANNAWGMSGAMSPHLSDVGGPTSGSVPGQMGHYQMPPQYQPMPIRTRLSPEAVEFDISNNPWNGPPGPRSTQMGPLETDNYKRLERNVTANWKHIVDKIVCSNDQQASIFLQQKLKVGSPEQKYEIVEAIVAQAYPLMINRFGNFLVQRCFEHGTPEQIVAIANIIRGNTLNLSMDAFGCHVVQKALDSVPEEYKAVMVHELLRRIPETVIHRYACHVWQKLFELRWTDSPPQIMKYVNEALRGMWHEVALGETGSLVVQNIFENCLEDDKRACINEVLASIDVIAHGQFGNWCIQHICEHGAPADRSRATEHILRFATEYSMDQYASKVIEKCLKIGGNDFLDKYLEKVCEGRSDRPRMPLIDIAGDQFGNYLIQYILIHASPHHRDLVAGHVRKHMVSLRGSKYGSRVAMLCCNPAVSTRPGPPGGMQLNRYNSTGSNRGSSYGAHYGVNHR